MSAFATPIELRAIADLADNINETARGLSHHGVLSIDNIQVYDAMGNAIGVLSWRSEADTFGVELGGSNAGSTTNQ